MYLENPFVLAMASLIRPSMEHGMAGVVHDSFRLEDSSAIGARNSAKHMNNLDFQECEDTRLQHTSLDLETKGFNEYGDGLMPKV